MQEHEDDDAGYQDDNSGEMPLAQRPSDKSDHLGPARDLDATTEHASHYGHALVPCSPDRSDHLNHGPASSSDHLNHGPARVHDARIKHVSHHGYASVSYSPRFPTPSPHESQCDSSLPQEAN